MFARPFILEIALISWPYQQHRSDTIDYIIMSTCDKSIHAFVHLDDDLSFGIIVSGEIISISPGKEEDFRLKAGDILVRKANAHGYKNPGPEWARYAVVILDAEPVVVDGKVLPEETPQFNA